MEAASVNETQVTLCVWLVGRKAAARAALAARRRAPAAGMSLSAYVLEESVCRTLQPRMAAADRVTGSASAKHWPARDTCGRRLLALRGQIAGLCGSLCPPGLDDEPVAVLWAPRARLGSGLSKMADIVEYLNI